MSELKNTKPVAKSAAKSSTKAARNTPVQKTAPRVFSLAAGVVVAIDCKHLKKALGYHVKKGTLVKTSAGHKLTDKGALEWNAERVAGNPEKFQAVAKMLHAGGEVVPEWSKQPVTTIAKDVRFPNQLYWGGFVSDIMRLAFAAIWAK